MSKRAADKHWSGYSSGYFNKLVKEDQEKFLRNVHSDDNFNSPTYNETIVQSDKVDGPSGTTNRSINPISESSEEELSDLDENFYNDVTFNLSAEEGFSSDITEVDDDNPLAKDLASFVVRRRVRTRTTDDLLHVLNNNGVRVPKTHNNLTKTPKEKINVRKIVGGSYYYRGIEKALKERAHLLKDLNHIVLDIGIDGASLFHSSHLQVWPSIGSIVDDFNIRPFLIGCFEGQRKFGNSDEFFDEFEIELLDLDRNGIELVVEGVSVHKSVSVRLFMLDSPARADFCKIKGHGSWQGCPLCKFTNRVAGDKSANSTSSAPAQSGDSSKKRKKEKVVYANTVGSIPRTDETYSNRLHPEHHKPGYIEQRSALEMMGFRMISQFPLDPMHIVDLGVVLKVLKFLKQMQNLPGHVIDIDQISERIVHFKNFCPSDFARDVRSLTYLDKFKATELKQFLYYGSIVFLKDLVDDYIYEHWLLLHVAIRLLACDNLTSDNIDVAEVLLKRFVEQFPMVYGEESVSYVVHVLMHIPFYSRLYGSLDRFSCYKYENYIQKLKGFIGNAHRTLQQIVNRMEEEDFYNIDSYTIPEFNTTEVSCNERDSFVAFQIDGKITPCRVVGIYERESTKHFAVRRCLNINNFYTSPIDSSEIGEVSYDLLDHTIERFKASDMVYKYCRIPHRTQTYNEPVPMENYNLTNFTIASLCSTSKGVINNSVAPEPLKKPNTMIKTPSFFVTLNKTPNGYVIANNNIHTKEQHSQNLSTSTVNQQENLHAHQADGLVLREGHGSRYLNETANLPRKENIIYQPKNGKAALAKKSTTTTALVSEIQSESNFGHGNYRLPNGISMSTSYKLPSVEPANNPTSRKPANKPQSVKPAYKPQPVKPAYKPQSVKPAYKPPSMKPAYKPTSIKPIINSTTAGHSTSVSVPSSLTKFNFPLPPKRSDFKIVTKTQFATAVDSQPAVTTKSSESVSSQSACSSVEFLSNGVPSDCQSFRKIGINVNHATSGVVNASRFEGDKVPASRHIPRLIPKPATISNSLFDDESFFDEELQGGSDDENLPTTPSSTGQNDNIDDLSKRVQNVEKIQVASAKQGSEVLIAVKKMAKSLARFVKYADDNSDEIRKLLPIKTYESLLLFDQRLIDEPDFRKNVLLYLRGFRGSGVPDHFTSVLRKIMIDDLLYNFNLAGIMGKHSLENFKLMDVIHDLYKPMDDDTFKSKMRKTLTMAKNRKNSSNFRKRRLDQ